MYNFIKLENEEIILISDESRLKKNEEEIIISTILTSKRIILLDYPDKSNNYEEVMRISKGADYILKKEPILIINLNEIKTLEEDDDFDKYLLKNSNYFYLNDPMVKSRIKELLNSDF